MYIENTILITGRWERIWELASEIENWVRWLPHYRKIIIESTSPGGLIKHAYMSAWRNILPVSWHTIQRLEPSDDPTQARVLYQHVKGVTKGMEVIWKFEPQSAGEDVYRVTISHNWNPKWPLIGGIASKLISELIVSNIADKTLARVRILAIEPENTGVVSKAGH